MSAPAASPTQPRTPPWQLLFQTTSSATLKRETVSECSTTAPGPSSTIDGRGQTTAGLPGTSIFSQPRPRRRSQCHGNDRCSQKLDRGEISGSDQSRFGPHPGRSQRRLDGGRGRCVAIASNVICLLARGGILKSGASWATTYRTSPAPASAALASSCRREGSEAVYGDYEILQYFQLLNSILQNSLALCGLVEKNDFICVRIDA
jgi:hypothetical protein